MFDPNNLPPGHPKRPEPILNAPPATIALAGVLIVIHLLLVLVPEATGDEILLTFGLRPDLFLAALDGKAPLAPGLWPLATHLFLHLEAFHLVTNVGFLLAFASPVERRLGWPAFLAIFLVTGVVGGLTQVWLVFGADPVGLSVGASGGIFGLMAVTLLLARYVLPGRLALGRVILVLMAINIIVGVISEFGLIGDFLIGWQAHAGGFAAGMAIGWLVTRRQKPAPRG